MPVTREQVLSHLQRDEPNYQQAARLGVEAIPHLVALIQGNNRSLAAKAVCLASYINAADSVAVLQMAATHAEPVVRVAAASSARRLTAVPASLVLTLLDDTDTGVRKWALRTLEVHPLAGVRAKVEEMLRSDPHSTVRQRARQVLASLPQ
jgi:hypothetical protein